MAFKRQFKIGDDWIDEDQIETRHVDRCDGCSEIVTEHQPDQHFRMTLEELDDDKDNSRVSHQVFTHSRTECVTAAAGRLAVRYLL